jgi:hypothetical protein
MKTLQIREYRDRDGRVWQEIPDSVLDRIAHAIPDNGLVVDGVRYSQVTMERPIAEYLVGPLEEIK